MHREHRILIDEYCLMNLCNLVHIFYKIWLALKTFLTHDCYYYVLTRQTNDPININVRFKVLLYTDKGSTTKFLNKYNTKNCVENVLKIFSKVSCLSRIRLVLPLQISIAINIKRAKVSKLLEDLFRSDSDLGYSST